MRLIEFLDPEGLSTARYDPAEDRMARAAPNDTRKKPLTLRRLNRLKRLRALRRLENMQREDLMQLMYAQPDEGGGGAPAF